jgi:hypothetical protein
MSYHNLFLGTVVGFIGSALFVVSAKLKCENAWSLSGYITESNKAQKYISEHPA